MGLGQEFKEKRESYGYSLEAVEDETKIRKFYIEALEREEFSSLPPRIYATGFVKRYARLLELDEQKLIAEFVSKAYGNELTEPNIKLTDTKKDTPKKPMVTKIIAAALFLALAMFIGYHAVNWITEKGISGIGTDKPKVKDNIDVVPQEKIEPQTVMKAAVKIEANYDCWLRILVDDELQYTGILRKGESLNFEGSKSVFLRAGNAGGIDITLNGNLIEPIGKINEVQEVILEAQEITI